MLKINKYFLLILAAAYFIALSTAFVYPYEKSNLLPDIDIAGQAFRQECVGMDKVLDILKIKPGMVILDIGAGAGYCSFLFAKTLGGTGQIFATDIRSDYAHYINVQAKAKGLTNLSAHLVKKDGVDAFYEQHKYDLIYISNVYHCFDNPVDYFKTMKKYLAKNGRLAVVLYHHVPLITKEDIIDLKGMIEKLSRELEANPFYRSLSEPTKNLIKGSKGQISEDLQNSLLADLNNMLSGPLFYRNFYDLNNNAPLILTKRSTLYFQQDPAFTEPERNLANWLIMCLREDGVFEKGQSGLNEKELRAVRKLNQLFFINTFKQYLNKGRVGFYLPSSDGNRQTSKFAVKRELALAGFKLAQEHELSAYYDLLVYE